MIYIRLIHVSLAVLSAAVERLLPLSTKRLEEKQQQKRKQKQKGRKTGEKKEDEKKNSSQEPQLQAVIEDIVDQLLDEATPSAELMKILYQRGSHLRRYRDILQTNVLVTKNKTGGWRTRKSVYMKDNNCDG